MPSDKSGASLNFTALDLAPSWAQGPHTSVAPVAPGRPGRPERRKVPSNPLRGRPMPRPRREGPAGGGDGDRRDYDRGHSEPSGYGRTGPAESPFLPIVVQFIPARQGMETLARHLAESRRAFSLGALTALFLAKPESLVVRLTPDRQALDPDGAPWPLFQCRICRAAYLDQEAAVNHVLALHLSYFYQVSEETTEPPSGNFVCVARCGFSGELIGPPNYHGYHERLTALHQERFSHLSFDAYRARLEMLRDAESIAAWSALMCKRSVYRPVAGPAAPGGDAAVEPSATEPDLNSRAEVREHFLRHGLHAAIQEGVSCILPGPVARNLDDGRLQRWIQAVWQREARSIMRTAITVRGMLRSMGFCSFKTGDQRVFMSAVIPNALEATDTVETIRRILEAVAQNPGCTRTALWELLGVSAADASGGVEARHFRWLVDKGRLVFFQDGTLAVPGQIHAIRAPTRRIGRRRRNANSRET